MKKEKSKFVVILATLQKVRSILEGKGFINMSSNFIVYATNLLLNFWVRRRDVWVHFDNGHSSWKWNSEELWKEMNCSKNCGGYLLGKKEKTRISMTLFAFPHIGSFKFVYFSRTTHSFKTNNKRASFTSTPIFLLIPFLPSLPFW